MARSISRQLDDLERRIEVLEDELGVEPDPELVADGGGVRSEWTLVCTEDGCDFRDQMAGDRHPRHGPPEDVKDVIREHKRSVDGEHMVRVEGRLGDVQIDPHLVNDGGRVVSYECENCGTITSCNVDEIGQRRCPECSAAVVATDGGDDLPPGDDRDPGHPVVRLRQALQQVEIVRDMIGRQVLDVDATLAEVEIDLRGSADLLEDLDNLERVIGGSLDEDVERAIQNLEEAPQKDSI